MSVTRATKENESQWSEEQKLFQAWLALPEDERQPATMDEVAAQIGVHRVTLSRWKVLPGFYDAVHSQAYTRLRETLPAVYRNIAKRAAHGDRREWVDLYLSLMGGAAAVAGANSTMTINNTMTEDEATTLLERSLNLKLTAHVVDDSPAKGTES